jgi:hypothetical protein
LIREEVHEINAPVAANLVVRQFCVFQQSNEMRPRHPKEVGGALCSQLLVLGDQDDGPAELHIARDVLEQSENGIGQFQPLAIGSDQSRSPELQHPVQLSDLGFVGLRQCDRFGDHGSA